MIKVGVYHMYSTFNTEPKTTNQNKKNKEKELTQSIDLKIPMKHETTTFCLLPFLAEKEAVVSEFNFC